MRTVAVIPSRYEPDRLRALLAVVAPDVDEVIVLDNGHDRLVVPQPNVRIVPTSGASIYGWWNQGWRLALEGGGPVNVAILNDDIRILPGTLPILATALRSADDIGAVYPDRRVRLGAGLPSRVELTVDRDPVGSREMTGYCFMLRAEAGLPRFDEGYAWWYGDTQFDEGVRLAGYGVAQVNGLPIEHTSDAEADGWARRPELEHLVEADGKRWAQLHATIRDGRWWPVSGELPRTVLLVPRRADGGHRDRLWAWCRARWEREFPEVGIFEGHHDDGPFNRSAAINRAAELAGDWDVAVVVDSDVFLRVSQVHDAIATAVETGHVTWAHRRWRGLSEASTAQVLRDEVDFGPQFQRFDMDLYVERTNPLSWSCCVAIPRAVWDDMGGFDERFRGWGFEDMAFMSVVCGLYGHERMEGDVYHLWHPRSEERIVQGRSRVTATPEYVTNARLGRRYMVALRRDHGLHDRPGLPSTEEERQKDIANLMRDDAAYGPAVARLGLPDWSRWWPTLEELRDGAKAHSEPPPRTSTVAVIIRSGGVPETWPERSAYLRESLASLSAHVTGPIVQRVVYADWDVSFRAELSAIATEHGFYVAGEGHHGFTESTRRLWSYIDRRIKADHVFLAEDDFTYDRDVDLVPMSESLERDPKLAQVALLRASYYPREHTRDTVLGWPADSFTARDRGNGHGRLEHRNFWTMNPSLFRRSITAQAWPKVQSSERVFGNVLLRDPLVRFAFWGEGDPWIRHIGAVRAGEGY